ncbi:DEAD/DEAH box helicase, partial [Arenibaculum sp.]|uniref:DEAD/DEAH box helicase n=1 Tax=Arenibaculum sp. TaxID=2865862 RepID=UPI002E16483B|nr:DEAD/DEAH box helicase [Arenibaculum sp.]
MHFDPAEPGLLPVAGLPPGYDAVHLARLARACAARGLLHVAADRRRLERLVRWLRFFDPDLELVILPPWDTAPYERNSPSPAVSAARVAAMMRMLEPADGPRLVLTSVYGALRRLPSRSSFEGMPLRAGPGEIGREALETWLLAAGYAPAGEVHGPGDYRMGHHLEIMPPGAGGPVELDLDDGAVMLPPMSEVVLDPAAAERFLSAYDRRFGSPDGRDPVAVAVAAGRRHAGMEQWLPLFHAGTQTLLEWLPDAAVSLDEAVGEFLPHRLAQIEAAYQGRKAAAEIGRRAHLPDYRPLPPEDLFLSAGQWEEALAARAVVELRQGPPAAGGMDAGGRPGPDLTAGPGALAGHLRRLRADRIPVVMAGRRAGDVARLARGLEPPAPRVDRFDPVEPVSLAVLDLEAGFVAPDLAVIARADLAGRARENGRRAPSVLEGRAALAPGDLVVHADHGIALCDGIEQVTPAGAPHDCVRLLYRDNDRLLVPVESMDLVWRYGPGGAPATLDRLGGEVWADRLGRVVGDLLGSARTLVEEARRRESAAGAPIVAHAAALRRFADRFPFTETEDQQAAIDAVTADLASGRPMDRLVVGDVGFGKTEVALRAAFAVASTGRQVAVVAPTLPLARQHLRDFQSRFAGFGIPVVGLMRTGRDAGQGKVRAALRAEGPLVAVGTHALLGRGVRFRDLALLIVDEEQRFGVAQKDRLRDVAAGVHMLSMSATPIPRTLELAVTGLRAISVIATPPAGRHPIATRVLDYEGGAIRDALMAECRRGGRSFYICPRIADLDEVRRRLAEHVPELRVVVAHGRMAPEDMDDAISGFAEGAADVLLATNIIESGLNIPAANTLVVHRADRFGLGDLHQLRGRVGRGSVRAFCLLTTEPGVPVPAAAARLARVAAHARPGAGLDLANADLDMRGAGNLVGEEQSGHLREVGAELFRDLLRRAVDAVRRGGEPEAFWTPRVALDLPVLIPDAYVRDVGERLTLYGRIARIQDDEEAETVAAELAERHGPPPTEV